MRFATFGCSHWRSHMRISSVSGPCSPGADRKCGIGHASCELSRFRVLDPAAAPAAGSLFKECAMSVKDKLNEAGNRVSEAATKAGHKISEGTEKAGDWVKEKAHEVGHRADETAQTVANKADEMKGSCGTDGCG